ncbi:MAG: hypothetical protein AB3N63_18605 [Puniceicoccaceae bacterium]
MKLTIRRELVAVLATCLLFSLASSQPSDLEQWTLDQVLEKVTDANGGQESIDDVTNVRLSGTVEGGANTYDFVLLKKRPDKIRMRFMFRGTAIESGFNGETGWRRQTRGDQSNVVELEGEELAAMRLESDFDGPLIGEPNEDVTLKLERVERIGRVDYFVISEKTARRTAYHYIDSRTFRELKVVTNRANNNGELEESQNHYHEYSKHGGIWVAHMVERVLPDGRIEKIRIKEVEVNPGILDLVFKKPD